MGIKESSLYKKIEAFFIGGADDRHINVEAAKRGGNAISGQLNYEATSLQVQSLKEWKMALLQATDPEEPNRAPLKKLYQSFTSDNHLMATIGNRIDEVRGTPFKLVDKSEKENPEMTALLQKMWFIEEAGFIDMALKSKYEGTKVLELFTLKEDGHLKEITAIDMAHIVPEKGLVIKEPGDTKGWNYKEGTFAHYYMQIGKDKMLGLFAELAPIVLAKKLGIGSWLDYIEKYGIPPIFVFTDRFDQKRMDELFDAMVNFKSNHFVIGQGGERIETGNQSNGGNAVVFKDLVGLANAEISKRINGGTGTTDEKAFVGTAEVHQKLLKTKIQLDKFFIRTLVNEELIPRLANLSPVYRGLLNYSFQWNDGENLTLKEFLDYVVSLSPYYEFDINELAEKANMPITAVKALQSVTPKEGEEGKSSQKKKLSPKPGFKK